MDGLSNWYVRRSRDRFWASDKQSPEKLDAYWTLYECLLTTCKLIAPFTPFIAETIWQNLGANIQQSVHLCDFPTGDAATVDEALSSVILSGDDYQSYFYGFDTKYQYRVVEVDPTGELRPLDAPFEVFIQKYVD